MSEQPELFYDSFLEALRDDVNACGGPKEVGCWFWPEKSLETARNSVNDRLNIERRDRFTNDQERLIIRKARERRGFSAAIAFLCDDTGFERPRPKEPEDERARLQREFVDSVRRLDAISEQLGRVGEQQQVRVVK